MPNEQHRQLPAVGVLLEQPRVRSLLATAPRSAVADAVRQSIAQVRAGAVPAPATPDGWADVVEATLAKAELPSLRRVINATGVVLHTNLGRAPLASQALAAIEAAARGATNLEYDLEHGRRGSRDVHAVSLLCSLLGAEDALIVNNCAAALVLALNTLANGARVLISRGELVEIGGSFRVPDIMGKSGAQLVEVGTTNRTHLADYFAPGTENAKAIVKVHRSNFEQHGYVAEAALRDLAALGQSKGIPVLYDFGSGLMVDLAPYGLSGEPLASDAVRDGAALTVMSGDKLLGGPQVGIMFGSTAQVAACRKNPLARALRVDKLRLAALEATLRLYREPATALVAIPVLAMLTASVESIAARAAALGAQLSSAGIRVAVVDSLGTVGGGAFPTAQIPSRALVPALPAEPLERSLRGGALPVVGRIEDGRLLLDLRSVQPTEDGLLVQSLREAAGRLSA